MNVLLIRQTFMDDAAHVRIEMDRIDEAMIRKSTGEREKRGADGFETITEVLPPMPGDQHVGMFAMNDLAREQFSKTGVDVRSEGIISLCRSTSRKRESITVFPVTWIRSSATRS